MQSVPIPISAITGAAIGIDTRDGQAYSGVGARFAPPLRGLLTMDITAVELLILVVAVTPIPTVADLFTRRDDAPALPGGNHLVWIQPNQTRHRSIQPTIRLRSHRV